MQKTSLNRSNCGNQRLISRLPQSILLFPALESRQSRGHKQKKSFEFQVSRRRRAHSGAQGAGAHVGRLREGAGFNYAG